MSWNREFWGVEFIDPGEQPTLIGAGWMTPMPQSQYDGEPTRALLFMTRAQARDWCRAKQAEYAGRTDRLGDWRFRAVKVVETVKRKT